MKTVMFCGHSKLNEHEKVKKWIYAETEKTILNGASEFLIGGYGDFDNLAAGVVFEMKKKYPNIKSVLVLAYPDKKTGIDSFDESVYPPLENVPKKYAIVKRNRWMVDNSDTIIAFVLYDFGGAAKTLNYAIKEKKNVIRYK